jgi:hypothetical protein
MHRCRYCVASSVAMKESCGAERARRTRCSGRVPPPCRVGPIALRRRAKCCNRLVRRESVTTFDHVSGEKVGPCRENDHTARPGSMQPTNLSQRKRSCCVFALSPSPQSCLPASPRCQQILESYQADGLAGLPNEQVNTIMVVRVRAESASWDQLDPAMKDLLRTFWNSGSTAVANAQ